MLFEQHINTLVHIKDSCFKIVPNPHQNLKIDRKYGPSYLKICFYQDHPNVSENKKIVVIHSSPENFPRKLRFPQFSTFKISTVLTQ